MKKIFNSVIVSLAVGANINEAEFPPIEGKIIGYGTHTIGARPVLSCRGTLLDGGNEVQRPVDVAFSETEGRANFMESLLPLDVPNPGRITARVNLDAVVPAGEAFKVEFFVLSEKPC